MIFNDIFNKDLHDTEWKKYWEELGVNFLRINEDANFNENVKSKIGSLCEMDCKILADILEIDYDDKFMEKISERSFGTASGDYDIW